MKKGSYLYVFLLGCDRFAAAVFFNRADITISALCWIVRYAKTDPIAFKALQQLRPSWFQHWFLARCSTMLEMIQKDHCVKARLSDLATSEATRNLLGVQDSPFPF